LPELAESIGRVTIDVAKTFYYKPKSRYDISKLIEINTTECS
jgi:hypothetical protein